MRPPGSKSAPASHTDNPGTPIDHVGAALGAIAREGAFAVELTCPSDDLVIDVRGLGALHLPMAARTARALATIARPAPFGRREATLHDATVRDTGQIDKRDITIDAARWARTLEPLLDVARARLGLPANTRLVAALDKLLVYGPGQFFKPHQDSERAPDMVASLVVVLPAEFAGGALVVEHDGVTRTFEGSQRQPGGLSMVAFYGDCRHEVKPVTRGHRVVLAYHLHQRAVRRALAAEPARDAAVVDRVAARVEAYFAAPVSRAYPRSAPEPPDRLVYLLDHEYSEKSLAWARLKNADRLRVDALRAAAERLDCEYYLALADVHENWNCDEEDWRDASERYDDDAEGEVDAGTYALLELNDSSIELRHWVARDGRTTPSASASVDASEVCWTRASAEMDPVKSEHEGYMGNYGNTVDHWYHRAAFVMWPRARNFVIRARVAPAWAVGELATRIKAGALAEAREGARSLIPFWAEAARREKGSTLVSRVLRLALALDDAELAFALLSPFGAHDLNERALPTLAALVERFGVAWSQRLFISWVPENAWDTRPWRAIVPALFAQLLVGAPRDGARLAQWLLTREVEAFERDRTAENQAPTRWLDDMDKGTHGARLLFLFDGARVIGAERARDRLVALISSGRSALRALHAGALLEACLEHRSPADVRALGLGELHRHVVETLGHEAARRRADGDWSIDLPASCSCNLCGVLWAFLRDRTRETFWWPLAKDRRQHVHGVIDVHHLPVTHVTIHTGSPHTLVVTKQRDLFTREASRRERQKVLLARLQKARRSFAT